MKKDPRDILSMILDMRSIYIKYLDKVNKTNKEHNKIYTCALELGQELYISNKKS